MDLSAYASWAGAYTSLYPDRITVSTLDPDYRDASALEMLFHESLHTYSDSVATALASAAGKAQVRLPRDLVHSTIFYTAGALTRRELGPSYVPYAFRLGIWKRGDFPDFLPLLEEEWQPYLDGRRPFDEAIAAIVRRLRAASSRTDSSSPARGPPVESPRSTGAMSRSEEAPAHRPRASSS